MEEVVKRIRVVEVVKRIGVVEVLLSVDHWANSCSWEKKDSPIIFAWEG